MQPQLRNSRSRFLNIVLGLGTANCCTLFSITGQLERFGEISYFDDRGFFACLVVALMLFACLPAFKVPLFRLVVTSFSLLLIVVWGISTAYCIFELARHGSLSEPALLFFISCGRMASVTITTQWNLHVALCNERQVVPIITLAMLASVGIYTLLCWISGLLALVVYLLLSLFSGISLILQERQANRLVLDTSANISPGSEDEETSKSPGEGSWWDSLLAVRIRFYGSRVLLAIIFGVLTTSVSDFAPPQPHSMVIVIAGSALIASGFLFVLHLSEKGAYRPVVAVFVHLILMAILFTSFYSDDTSGYVRVFAAICHTTWFSLTYFQAPTYRRIMRMNPVTFAYSDRLCSFIVLEAVMWIAMLLKGQPTPTIPQMQVIASAQWCAVVVLAIAALIMVRHFMSYYPEDTVYGERNDRFPHIEEKSKEDIIQTISRKYCLTKRETEVFRLLALGYSRPYIQKRLFISEGTVKTHSRSIYVKLKVSNKDELLELVDTGDREKTTPLKA